LHWRAGKNGNTTSVTEDNTENFLSNNFISNLVTVLNQVTTLSKNFYIHRKTTVTKKSDFYGGPGSW